MPGGWRRKINGQFVDYEHVIYSESYGRDVTPVGVSCGAHGVFVDAPDYPLPPSTVEILRRAFRQHEHLKAGAGEALGEEEEEA